MSSPQVGQKLGSFRLVSELGAGAMGIVYKAVNETKENRPAAVKVILGDQGLKGKGFERFIREAKILEKFRHKNIVKYYARGKSAGTYYYAMEYIEGQTLDQVIKAEGALPWRRVVELGIQICDALEYAHDHQVIHRDLKPSNLMLAPNDVVKLTDFGIAKPLDATEDLTATGRTLGTAAYMAPEQIKGTPEISHKTDLYALGAVLYQLLTGNIPYQADSAVALMTAHLTRTPPRPSEKVHEIPRALDDLVVKLLAKTPGERPMDALAVSEILRALKIRDEQKQTIPMVWPGTGTDGIPMGSTLGIDQGDGLRTQAGSRKKKKKPAQGTEREPFEIPEWAGVAGLVAALAVIAGIVAYAFWPPSAEYLFRKAEPLMASEKPEDWRVARDQYLEELDAKHPDHPYRDKTEPFHDKLLLHNTERRADVIERNPLFGKPKEGPESLFAVTNGEAAGATQREDLPGIVEAWGRMVAKLEGSKEKEDRGWLLLAKSRQGAAKSLLESKRQLVLDKLEQVASAEKASDFARSKELRTQIFEQYSKTKGLEDLIKRAQESPPAPEKPKDDGKKAEDPPANP